MKIAVLTATMLVFAIPALADEDCRLMQIADFTLKKGQNGQYLFPITFDGQERWFELGLHTPFSVILGSFADAQKFPSRPLPVGIEPKVNGEKVMQEVAVGGFNIGLSHAGKFDMLRFEGTLDAGPDVTGIAGMDMLANFDVELDLKNSHMNLFSQNHCIGQVVYWADSYAKVPFENDPSGHFSFKMQLDGKRVDVDFDAASGTAAMGTNVAKRIFGLDENAPEMQTLLDKTQTFYRYRFKQLALGDIAIENPAIVIFRQEGPECKPYRPFQAFGGKVCFGTADLTLRESEPSQMHLYFAFKEKMLYATAADAVRAKTP